VDAVRTQRKDYFLLATAWREGKNLESMLRSLGEHRNINLKLAGTWIHESYRQKIESIINERGLGKQVEILGGVSEEKLDLLYQHALAAIIYNDEKGLGLTALEAAANGCTFVVPRTCGIARYFDDGVDGIYYDFGNDDELFSVLNRLKSDEKTCVRLGTSAWEKVETKYGWRQHTQIIDEALNG
jgi:glycosyltransferase involved in cell wall biosynthesis